MSGLGPFFDRVGRRKIVQWALAYLAGAWLLLQVLDLLGDVYAWPAAALRSVPLLLSVGFLAALVLAWYHGEKGEQRITGIEIGMLTALLILAGAAVAFVGGGVERRGDAEARGRGENPGSALALAPVPEQGSVAVLPFVNMSSDPEQEYFADGLTEELLNVLAQLPELRVAARTSSFFFKGENVPIDSVARALRVAHVLEGSVRKAGDRVRITAQLIEAEGGFHLWSETYDRQLTDIFAVQEEIARSIVDALELELGGGRVGTRLAKEETEDPEAHAALLRGLHFARHDTRDMYRQAAAHFRQAIALDPDYARAHAELAGVHAYQAYRRWGPRQALIDEARDAVARAMALDPDLPQAHHALGEIAYHHDWDFSAAEAYFRRAITLNPGLARSHAMRGWVLAALARPDEALAAAGRATELDPVSAEMFHNAGGIYAYADRLDRAVDAYRTSLALRPENPSSLVAIAQIYSLLGRTEEALDAAERARARSPDDQWSLAVWAYVLARAGRRTEAEPVIRVLEAQPDPAPYLVAIAYAGLGDADRVFMLLERSIDQKDAAAPDLGVDPIFDPFRNDPRMRRLLDRMGLP